MAWPDRPQKLPLRTELAFGADPTGDPATWTWTDVSEHVEDQSITINRGRGEEGGETRPASTGLELVNNGGDYTPGHAGGAHYPHVRLGVPARLSVQVGGPHLRVPGNPQARAFAASSPALNVEDLDVRVEMALDRLPGQFGATAATATGWRPWQAAPLEIIGRYDLNAVDTTMWMVTINQTGTPVLYWRSPAGSNSRAATEPLPYSSGQRFALRVTLDIDNGSGGHSVTFWRAPSLDGPWSVLGQPFVGTGTTSIAQTGEVPLDLGSIARITWPTAAGRYYRAEMRNGIDGTVVAAPDFRALQPGATSWTDSAGRSWSLMDGAEITDWVPHVTGTVDEWAPNWPWGDLSAPDYDGEARTDITISGILRRLGTGQPPLQSALRRRLPAGNPLAYWPLEDEPGATSAASGLDSGKPLNVIGLRFGQTTSLLSSDALPTVTAGARIRANLRAGAEGEWAVTMLYNLAQLPQSDSVFFEVQADRGVWTSYRITLTSDAVACDAINDSGSSSSTTRLFYVFGSTFVGGWRRFTLQATQTGSTTEVRGIWRFLNGDGGGSAAGTFTGSAGVLSRIDTTFGAGLEGMTIGHLSVMRRDDVWVYAAAEDGFAGETAVARMRRLAEEVRFPLSVAGAASMSPAMGPQRVATFLDLIQECVDADGGILTELRAMPGLQYRSRDSLLNQAPTLILDAQANEIAAPFSPVLDDQRTRNRITVSREGGSSATVEDAESIAESGIYDSSTQLNVAYDTQLEALAGWRLHLGTVRGMRYPQVGADLAIAPRLIDGWLSVDSGTRIDVTGLPPQHPQGTVPLMVEGTTETITPTRWTVRATCSPASPWTAGVVGDDQLGRVDTDGTVLVGPVAAADGAMLTRVTVGPAWTRAASELPYVLNADGEEVTVTAVADVFDTFQRTVTGGWGTASGGLPWLLGGGAAADRSVSAGRGVVTVSSATISAVRIQVLAGPLGDAEVRVRMSVPQVSTGAALVPGVLLRYADGSNYYRARLHFNPGGTLSTSITRTVTQVGSTVTVSGDYTAASEFEVRARVDGHRIRMRVWPVGGAEPTIWHQDQTITTDPIEHGLVGVTASGLTGNTNVDPQIRFDLFEAVGVQQMTVTRPNPQDHAAGGDVRLAQPAIVI
ncbi:hypothetical protein [Streptomyces sp. OUCMDZ-3434]|uniref:hypothetical protein n=1 Tax=Streptomyces sp. OUCMDZ-3434 TaxID=1535304 RepID=UPI001E52F34D|nr:hypothetical protein [Streptomyces sp. OUCMDZ-3434]